jgi:hypothetical protein
MTINTQFENLTTGDKLEIDTIEGAFFTSAPNLFNATLENTYIEGVLGKSSLLSQEYTPKIFDLVFKVFAGNANSVERLIYFFSTKGEFLFKANSYLSNPDVKFTVNSTSLEAFSQEGETLTINCTAQYGVFIQEIDKELVYSKISKSWTFPYWIEQGKPVPITAVESLSVIDIKDNQSITEVGWSFQLTFSRLVQCNTFSLQYIYDDTRAATIFLRNVAGFAMSEKLIIEVNDDIKIYSVMQNGTIRELYQNIDYVTTDFFLIHKGDSQLKIWIDEQLMNPQDISAGSLKWTELQRSILL